ncbi:MAG: hypothetical protein ACFE9Q_11290 [Candidatus Hodarchaeota archaeon]
MNSYDSKIALRNMIQVFTQIIDILKNYKGNYNKKLNFTGLLEQLKIPTSEIDEVISLILAFQEIFENIFQGYKLKKQRANNKVYLIAVRNGKAYRDNVPQTIRIKQSYIRLLNDIIYTFKFVKRGKGFNIAKNGSDLLSNLKQIKKEHPYLFESYGNGVIYPSKLGLQLGELIISYNKSNKEINSIQVGNYTFIVEKDK